MDEETLLPLDDSQDAWTLIQPRLFFRRMPKSLSYTRRTLIVITIGVSICVLVTVLLLSRGVSDVALDLNSPFKDPGLHEVPHGDPSSTDNEFDNLVPARDYSKEAYMTLLSPSNPHPWTEGRPDYYFEACKVIAHRLLRNPTTRDPFNRPYIILVTPNVPEKQIEILESHGATIKRVPIIDPPPGTVDFNHINPRYRDQFTKFHVWNMTQYNRIAYFDADTLMIRPFHSIFDTPVQHKGDETWLFAAVYDSGRSRGSNNRNPPGLEDKGRPEDKDINAGVFFLYPTQSQSEYIFDMLRNPPKKDFTVFMEQDMLRWAYRDDGPYPWVRLSHLYNTQWCKGWDLDTAYVLHDKFWLPAADDELRKTWYQAWSEMIGWDAARHVDGLKHWQEESGICNHKV